MGAAKMWGLSLQSWACGGGGVELRARSLGPSTFLGPPLRLPHVLTSLFPA